MWNKWGPSPNMKGPASRLTYQFMHTKNEDKIKNIFHFFNIFDVNCMRLESPAIILCTKLTLIYGLESILYLVVMILLLLYTVTAQVC